MKYKQLGRTALTVSTISLGTLTVGTELNEKDSTNLIKNSLAAGINFLDTSDTYGAGKSEEFVGKAIKGERDAVLLATEVGRRPGPRDLGTLSRKSIMMSAWLGVFAPAGLPGNLVGRHTTAVRSLRAG